MHLYLGGYGDSIYRATLDGETGELSEAVAAGACKNPSFLAVHPTRPVLYAAVDGGKQGGGAAAFGIDPATRDLTPMGERFHGGGGTCYVCVAGGGRLLLTADYGGGSVAAFSIGDDGSLGERAFFDQHDGDVGPQKDRQDKPHAHCFQEAPGGRFALSCDLGTDEVYVYRIGDDATVERHEPATFRVAPGAGPRHVAWSPDARHLYVLGELDNTLTIFAWDGEAGTARQLGVAPLLPEGFAAFSKAAEVAVHPSGRFVYGSNRGHESIASFSRDAETGLLTPTGHRKTGGEHPRHFSLSPDGRRLVVANQDTSDVFAFDVCEQTGELTPSGGGPISVPKPTCVRFVREI